MHNLFEGNLLKPADQSSRRELREVEQLIESGVEPFGVSKRHIEKFFALFARNRTLAYDAQRIQHRTQRRAQLM